MNSPLNVCAAGLVVVCVGCGVYLSRPTPEFVAAPPEPFRSSVAVYGPASGAPSISPLNVQSDSDERQVDSPASTATAVVTFQAGHAREQVAASHVQTAPAALIFTNRVSQMRGSERADRTVPARAAESPIEGKSFVAVQTVHTSSPHSAELSVPFGASLPVTFLDPGIDATPAQVAALDQIASDFVQEATVEDQLDASESARLAAARGKRGKDFPGPQWDSATAHANERYRLLFGVEAYNARLAAAAREALAEQQGKAR